METNSNFYRYKVSRCDLLIPNEDPITLSGSAVRGLKIEKDFDKYYFPIFSIDLFIDGETYYKIVNYKTTVKFNIKVEKYKKDKNGGDEYEFRETVIDSLFGIFIDDDSFFVDKELLQKSKELGNTLTGQLYTFYLFKDEDISASKKTINAVIKTASMTDAVTYLLSKSGTKKVLMSPFDNTREYDQVMLLPTTVIKNINNLEKQYGFYKNGTVFFYDFNMIYLLNKTSKCTAYQQGEYTDVVVTCFKRLNSNSATPGSYRDDSSKTYVLHISQNNIELSTNSIIEDQVSGSNIKMIDPTSGTVSNIKPDIQTRNKSRTQVLVNNLENNYLPTVLENQKYENANILTFNIFDFDSDCLAPNKKYIISFEDKEVHTKYKGEYRLTSYTAFLVQQGTEFDIRATVTMKKSIER